MIKNKHLFLLLSIIVIEGYIVLSSELLAIRQTLTFVGSGTETISIIIAAVLMPLACGYYAGGKFKPGLRKNGKYVSIRKKLIFNIMVSSVILLFGISHFFLDLQFNLMLEHVSTNRLIVTTIYAVLFIAPPVYLLGQTIPLVSNYFSRQKLAEITGKMLFFSTIGSFLGAVFSTLVLMSTIGVHNTVIINFALMSALVIMLSKRKRSLTVFWSCIITFAAFVFNSGAMMSALNIVENNQYNTIQILTQGKDRHLLINNNPSSKYNDNGDIYPNIAFAQKVAFENISDVNTPKDVLVIGAGAFTFGVEDEKNNYDYVDIDKSLKDIAEEYILQKKITANKTFHPIPARAYLAQTDKKYDVIFLDTYFGKITLPEHLITRDFFKEVKAHMKDESVIVMNMSASPNFASAFSRNLDNTVRAVFPYVSRHILNDGYALWNNNKTYMTNVMYVYRHRSDFGKASIYTDNKNRSFLDKP